MHTYDELADLIFPEITKKISNLEKQYPPRDLSQGAEVTRFAPSPTGFLHTGSLFTSMIACKVAKQSGGIYYFRLEDTDQKREIEGSANQLIDQLKEFGIIQDEGFFGNEDKGNYGPYVQSKRGEIYKICIKELIKKGRAYPCFCSQEELNLLRTTQEANRVIPGYYGEYAKCRYLSIDEAYQKIQNGEKYVIRFKSLGDHNNYIRIHDEVRGDLDLTENDQDIVIMKSDGLPTYHFAHAVDDHFMHTTIVTRGEEWISSLPIHVELFDALNFLRVKYAHLPVIMKLDNGNKRKLSKRKDPEAAVSFFLQEGYPTLGIIKYLMTIANSNFEEWLIQNPNEDINNFKFTFNKMSLDGALFDLPKLQNICKETLAYFSKEEITAQAKKWASVYSKDLLDLINQDEEKFTKIMNIERGGIKPRKDYTKYSDIYSHIEFFYNKNYDELVKLNGFKFNENISKEDTISILKTFKETMDYSLNQEDWFNNLKALGEKNNFASNFKEYKKNKDAYKGHVGDIANMIRISLTTSPMSPNLYDILHILDKQEIERRIDLAISSIK